MKDQTKKWLEYADENLRSAKILLDSQLFNPCLQNIQQAVEKMLKAGLAELTVKIKKTHSINELAMILADNGLHVNIEDDECDLLDSIYLPSKYPVISVLPDFEPDITICRQCIEIAERVKYSVRNFLSKSN
jgi:HEPN domain-containing protein